MTAATAGSPRPAAPESSVPDPGSRDRLYIHAGQVAVVTRASAITTILGSCVAVCLFDERAGVGGMNHYLLPYPVEREQSARFGTVAIPDLIDQVLRAGASQAGLRAKVYGGASVISAFRRSLGEENAALALRLLDEAGIPVLHHDTGGARGRKLIFQTDDGTAWVRHL
jgi:chemotaxis protein CheD